MKKIKNWKVIRWLSKKCRAVRSFFLKSFENTSPGSVFLSVLISTCLLAGYFHMGFPAIPKAVGFFITAALVILAAELLCLIVRLAFKSRIRNRVYFFLMFLTVAACCVIASQATLIVVCLLFSLIFAIMGSLLGRCLWAMIRHKRHTVLIITLLVLSVSCLAVTIVWLGGEGSKKSYIPDYLAMTKLPGGAAPLALTYADAGEYSVASLTYGPDPDRDIYSSTYDLSPFAEQGLRDRFNRSRVLNYGLSDAPIEGKIWYPQGQSSCPVLFIVHGNHEYNVDSYLGYDYLGEYLASFGYVVVSINENACNELSAENDARAVLLLENIKFVLAQNDDLSGKLYRLIDPAQIAIAGHSRGGEAVSEAYLFNEYDSYPENGNISFSYHFNIRSVIAIAPTVDQYRPAQHAVVLENVNYLIIHGSNDQDVSITMGQKQYHNVRFTDGGRYIKTMLYVSGANHGQFNTTWGKYDLSYPTKPFLNVANFIEESEQHRILEIFVKTFLDVTLKEDTAEALLLTDCHRYESGLPRTVYQQMYQTSAFLCLADFENDSNLNTASIPGGRLSAANLKYWTEELLSFGYESIGENYVLKIGWEDTRDAGISLSLPGMDLTGKNVVFDLADAGEETGTPPPDGMVTLTDADGNTASVRISDLSVVYPSLPVQLRKLDVLFGNYEYKHPFQTVSLPVSAFVEANASLDTGRIVRLSVCFDHSDTGSVFLDNIGLEE